MNQPLVDAQHPSSGRIRVLALGLVQQGDRLLVAEGYDPVKQQAFYRALGGGVEFGESSREALVREFQEELRVDLLNIEYLGCIENRFVYQGRPGHEIIQLYQCDLADASLYDQPTLTGYEGDECFIAHWIACDRFHHGHLHLVPPECLKYLR